MGTYKGVVRESVPRRRNERDGHEVAEWEEREAAQEHLLAERPFQTCARGSSGPGSLRTGRIGRAVGVRGQHGSAASSDSHCGGRTTAPVESCSIGAATGGSTSTRAASEEAAALSRAKKGLPSTASSPRRTPIRCRPARQPSFSHGTVTHSRARGTHFIRFVPKVSPPSAPASSTS